MYKEIPEYHLPEFCTVPEYYQQPLHDHFSSSSCHPLPVPYHKQKIRVK